MPDENERRPWREGGAREVQAGSSTEAMVTHKAEPPVSLARAVAELLELSDERDTWMARLGDEYKLGYKLGYAQGVADAQREADEAWLRTPQLRLHPGLTYAELERRRYGPGGREHFSDPRPGDYKGRREGAA